MTRETITMINRRRCLADTLNACTQAEIRQEVAAALHRKFPAKGHAAHCAVEILEATMEHGMPPRDTGFDGATVLLAQPEKREWWQAVAAIAAIALACLAVYAISAAVVSSIDGTNSQIQQGAVEW